MTTSNERETRIYTQRTVRRQHLNETPSLTPGETTVAASFAELLKAGIPPSPKALSSLIKDEEGKSKYHEQGIGLIISSLGLKLPHLNGQVSDLLGDKTAWPDSMPIQTLGELGGTLQHYGRSKRKQNMLDRLPENVKKWMEDNRNPLAFPDLNPRAKKSDLKDLELVETDLVIAGRLLVIDPNQGYQYPHPLDIVPDIKNLAEFQTIDPAYYPGYIENAVFMIPKRYWHASVIREEALKREEKDPTKEMRVGKMIQMVEQTNIAPDLTLKGVSSRNLYLILSRSLPFKEMQRRIIAAQ